MKFKRSNPELGTAYFSIGDKTIKIEGRQIFETEDKKEIEFLSKDPEVVEVKMTKTYPVSDKSKKSGHLGSLK